MYKCLAMQHLPVGPHQVVGFTSPDCSPDYLRAGGAKVVDKVHIIDILIDKADKILIGGKMAFTFLAAKGVPVGATYVEEKHRVEVVPFAKCRLTQCIS